MTGVLHCGYCVMSWGDVDWMVYCYLVVGVWLGVDRDGGLDKKEFP